MKTLTETFNSISVKKGEAFAIELPENGSTGFGWSLWLRCGKATLTDTVSVPDSPAGGMDGGSGETKRWIYRAEADGDIEIRADYCRPWESRPPAKTHNFRIKVS